MSYAEHGPRIFLTGRPNSGTPLTYGDFVVPKKRSEGRLKLYNSCTDIRAWSPYALECSHYFRELNEHDPAPGRVVPLNVVMDNMIGLTAQAQSELRAVRRELQKYKSLRLTSEQQKYLENFDKAAVGTGETEGTRTEPVIRALPREGRGLLSANIASLQNSDTYLSIYFHPYRYNKGARNWLLTNTPVQRASLNPLFESNAYLVPRVMSCDILTDEKATRDSKSDQANVCIEYADASFQAAQDVREAAMQTDECKNIDEYDKQSNVGTTSSQYYESSESVSTSESESGVNTESEVCEKRIIIQKDSEIIVLKNELAMKDDELDELRELNRDLQTLLEEKDENANILKRNLNAMQEKLKIMKNQRNDEVGELSAKLSSTECLVDQLKAELSRKCQVCYFQSQEIQKLREQVKEAELLSAENESLKRKVREVEHLSREAESCGIALEQVKNVWRERDMLQKQCHEQSCTLVDREDEIKRLLTLIKQMSVTADAREVEMNHVVVSLRSEIQAKNDKISQCEMQLVCMEREVGNLTSRLKSSLNNLDESKIAYESICEYTKYEHDTCLDVQSALSALKAFIAELEECKLERHNRLRGIDNLKACVACYSQELSASELTSVDFDIGRGSIRPPAEDIATSSNCDDCHSTSKEVVNVQIQSDDVDSTTTCSAGSEKVRLNDVISYEEIDRALATHIKRSIDKIHEISAVLQGAGDHHVQIVKEFARQQQELQRKDREITELRQKVTEHVLRRGEGDCAIQEQLRKRMLEKEKMMEAAINNRDTEIEKLHEHLAILENKISSYRAERDTLKAENADLVELRRALSKENDAQSEELRAQREQMRKLTQQMEVLKQTINILKKDTENIDDMRKKLIDLEMKNNDLTNELAQANEAVCRNAKIIADLKSKDERNRMALTHGSIKYDAMVTQKHSDIVKLRDENQSLRDRLRTAEIELAQSDDAISLLRRECDNVAAMNSLQVSLDTDKEKLLAKVDYLKSEIESYQSSTASVECELRVLSRENETLRTSIETVRSTNDQLSHVHGDTMAQSLKDALWTLPEKIYNRIVRISREISEHNEESKNERSEETLGTEDEKSARRTRRHADKACQQDEEFCASRRTDDKFESFAKEEDFNTENVSRRLRFLERQHEEKQWEIKSLMNDVKLRDYEIKNLQEYLTYLLQEKNELQNKVKVQVEEYQSKLTIMKKKYDGSLNAFRRRHSETVERLQARFEDIVRVERSPFDAESWLQSLDLRELTELHNRINILSSHAAENGKSDGMSTEAWNRSGPEEHRFFNKFTLHKQYTSESKTSLSKKVNRKKSTSKVHNTESSKTIAVTELFSRDLKNKQDHRSPTEKRRHSGNAEAPAKPKADRILDRQREKFIYQCSIQHKLNNAR